MILESAPNYTVLLNKLQLAITECPKFRQTRPERHKVHNIGIYQTMSNQVPRATDEKNVWPEYGETGRFA